MRPGETIGKYVLVNRLGRGGMGEVWLAQANGYGGFEKRVVLKTLLPQHEDDPLFIDMLAHEARTCGRLHHPNLIEVFDFSRHGRTYLLAMEYVDGASLSQIVRTAAARGWAIPPWFALRVAWECARGLECAHEAGVIHCDLSPSNVMVTFAGVTKILDFGVAHESKDGDRADRLKGKFSYMAPERIRELATDRRTDIYALGVMLYLLFTGRLPYVAANDEELLRAKQAPPAPPSVHGPIDPEIERVILRALEPDPDTRFQDAAELLARLTPCMAGQLGTYGQLDASVFVTSLFDGVRAQGSAPLPRVVPHALPAIPPLPASGIPEALADRDSRAITARAELDGEGEIDIEVVEPPRAPSEPALVVVDDDLAPQLPEREPSRVHSLFGPARPARDTAHPDVSKVFGTRVARERRAVTPTGWAWPWPTSRKTD